MYMHPKHLLNIYPLDISMFIAILLHNFISEVIHQKRQRNRETFYYSKFLCPLL